MQRFMTFERCRSWPLRTWLGLLVAALGMLVLGLDAWTALVTRVNG